MRNSNTIIAVLLISIATFFYDGGGSFARAKVVDVDLDVEEEEHRDDHESLSFCNESDHAHADEHNNNHSYGCYSSSTNQKPNRNRNLEYQYDKEYCKCLPLPLNQKEGQRRESSAPAPAPASSSAARIAYLITLHNRRTLRQSLQLLKSIASPGFIILIHVDTKLKLKTFHKDHKDDVYENEDEYSELMSFINDCIYDSKSESESDSYSCNFNCCGAKVIVDSIYDSKWGQWSMLEPKIWGECIKFSCFFDRLTIYIYICID